MKRTPLKRTAFKKKITKPLKKTKLGKKGKSEISKVQRDLWELCKQITREKYGNVCYTCGKTGLVGSDWHTAHFIPKSVSGAYLKYDLRNLRPGCYRCNINLGGNGSVYYKNLVEREGQEYVDQIFEDRKKTVKAIDHYKNLILEYEIYRRTNTNPLKGKKAGNTRLRHLPPCS